MNTDDEITLWLESLKEGDDRAADVLWKSYFEQLLRLARAKLSGISRRERDEEDVAISAMDSFFRGAKAGRFSNLSGRNDLWRLLVTITARKAALEARRQTRQKRGGGKVRGESVFAQRDGDHGMGIQQVLGRTPSPELANIMAETCERLFLLLNDATLTNVALLKMEGHTNEEISRQLDCTVRTVERKVERIRQKWAGHVDDHS